MNITLIDNYDSFTYNIVQILAVLPNVNLSVYRSHEVSLRAVENTKPDKILISPGPGSPEEAVLSCKIISKLGNRIPILGVCLGHQAIASVFGAKVVKYKNPFHGKTSLVYHSADGIYKGVPSPISVMRYHSLIVDRKTIPDSLIISSETEEGIIMGIKHVSLPVQGVQFHPESVLSDYGTAILKNWVNQ